jgi:hypothetical protein
VERGATVITGNVTAKRVTHISTNDIERALTCTGNQVDGVNSGQCFELRGRHRRRLAVAG